jgi:hypothetical protein
VLRVFRRSEGEIQIRITAAGACVVINKQTWPEGTVLTVPKYDGEMFLRNGFGEVVKDEPAPKGEAAENDGRSA